MTIKTRFLLGFLVISAFFVLVAVYTRYSFDKIYSIHEQMLEDDSSIAVSAMQAVRLTMQLRRNEKHAFLNATDNDEKERLIQQFLDINIQLHSILNKISSAEKENNTYNCGIKQNASLLPHLYERYISELINLINTNSNGILDNYPLHDPHGQQNNHIKNLDSIAASIRTQTTNIIKKYKQHALYETQSAVTNMNSIILSGMLVSSFVGIVLCWTIIRPLRRGTEFVNSVVSGDYSKQLTTVNNDAISVLFNRIILLANQSKELALNSVKGCDPVHVGDCGPGGEARIAPAAGESAPAGTGWKPRTSQRLEKIAETIGNASRRLSSLLEQSGHAFEHQARRASDAAEAAEEVDACLFEMAREASQTARTADAANAKTRESAGMTARMASDMCEVQVQAREIKADMLALGKRTASIGRILTSVSGVVEQAKLLTLRASVEASRAGAAGSGVAAVAEEVARFSSMTRTAMEDIGEAALEIQCGTWRNVSNIAREVESIEQAVALAAQSSQALGALLELTASTSDLTLSVSAAAQRHSTSCGAITQSMAELGSSSRRTAQAVREASAAVADLTGQSQVLSRLLQGTGGAAAQGEQSPGKPGGHPPPG